MKQADKAESNEEANRLNDRAIALKVSNSKLELRIGQLDRSTKSLLQDMKKVGPNLKDLRLKLKQELDSGLAKEAQRLPRHNQKCRIFRLNDDQIKAISAYVVAVCAHGSLAQTQPGNAAHGKELFETRGCLACHSIGEGDRVSRAEPSPRTHSRG